MKLRDRPIVRHDPTARHGDGARPLGRREGALGGAVAIASPLVRPFVPSRYERDGELFTQADVQGFANVQAELRFDVATKLQNRCVLLRRRY